MANKEDFLCRVCDKTYPWEPLPANDRRRRRVCGACREWHEWCNGCSKGKLRSEFTVSKTHGSSGLQSRCDDCLSQRSAYKLYACPWCDCEFIGRGPRFNGNGKPMCNACLPFYKHCSMCDTAKLLEEFNASKGKASGRAAHCKSCMADKWSKVDDRKRAAAKLRNFGISFDEFQKMEALQGGLCAICKKPETDSRNGKVQSLSIDHDHVTGKIRNLLCGACNKGIGLLRDDPDLLRTAARYLELHREAT